MINQCASMRLTGKDSVSGGLGLFSSILDTLSKLRLPTMYRIFTKEGLE